MKIDKLYALPQFVDHMRSIESEYIIGQNCNAGRAEMYLEICQYSDFLKQPLKKEMFVNAEIHSPNAWELGIGNSNNWEEAEKKVIFDDVEVIEDKHAFNILVDDKWQLIKNEGQRYWWMRDSTSRSIDTKYIKTLHDLAEATKGELKLKNIEL